MDASIVGCILPFLSLRDAETWGITCKTCYRLIMENPVHRKRVRVFLTRAIQGFAFVRRSGAVFHREELHWRNKLIQYKSKEIDFIFSFLKERES